MRGRWYFSWFWCECHSGVVVAIVVVSATAVVLVVVVVSANAGVVDFDVIEDGGIVVGGGFVGGRAVTAFEKV